MIFDMGLRGFGSVVHCVFVVTASQVGVMCRCLVPPGLVVFCGFLMVSCRVLMMLCCLVVMLCCSF